MKIKHINEISEIVDALLKTALYLMCVILGLLVWIAFSVEIKAALRFISLTINSLVR